MVVTPTLFIIQLPLATFCLFLPSFFFLACIIIKQIPNPVAIKILPLTSANNYGIFIYTLGHLSLTKISITPVI